MTATPIPRTLALTSTAISTSASSTRCRPAARPSSPAAPPRSAPPTSGSLCANKLHKAVRPTSSTQSSKARKTTSRSWTSPRMWKSQVSESAGQRVSKPQKQRPKGRRLRSLSPQSRSCARPPRCTTNSAPAAAGLRLGLLHGRLSADDKEVTMARFQRGEIDVLVATTVIEVGVDVANASVMVIDHAERFGLAQMHQLRGRVGRGAAKSYCILMTGGKVTEQADARLNAMVANAEWLRPRRARPAAARPRRVLRHAPSRPARVPRRQPAARPRRARTGQARSRTLRRQARSRTHRSRDRRRLGPPQSSNGSAATAWSKLNSASTPRSCPRSSTPAQPRGCGCLCPALWSCRTP
jgi:hypothetical protein